MLFLQNSYGLVIRKSFFSQSFLLLVIRKTKCSQQNEENEVSVSTLNAKKIKSLSLILLKGNETPLIFQKLKLNNYSMDYIMRSQSADY